MQGEGSVYQQTIFLYHSGLFYYGLKSQEFLPPSFFVIS